MNGPDKYLSHYSARLGLSDSELRARLEEEWSAVGFRIERDRLSAEIKGEALGRNRQKGFRQK